MSRGSATWIITQRDRRFRDVAGRAGDARLTCAQPTPAAFALRKQPLGALQMRPVVHLPVDADDAGIARGREGRDDRAWHARPPRRDGVKASLMTGTCAGWIAILAVKPSRSASRHSARRPSRSRKLTKTVSIAATSASGRGEDGDGAREPEDVGVAAVLVARGARADRGGKILRAPGQPGEARAGARDRSRPRARRRRSR